MLVFSTPTYPYHSADTPAKWRRSLRTSPATNLDYLDSLDGSGINKP